MPCPSQPLPYCHYTTFYHYHHLLPLSSSLFLPSPHDNTNGIWGGICLGKMQREIIYLRQLLSKKKEEDQEESLEESYRKMNNFYNALTTWIPNFILRDSWNIISLQHFLFLVIKIIIYNLIFTQCTKCVLSPIIMQGVDEGQSTLFNQH